MTDKTKKIAAMVFCLGVCGTLAAGPQYFFG